MQRITFLGSFSGSWQSTWPKTVSDMPSMPATGWYIFVQTCEPRMSWIGAPRHTATVLLAIWPVLMLLGDKKLDGDEAYRSYRAPGTVLL